MGVWVRWFAAVLATVLLAACGRGPEPQSFGSAVPEPARGLAFAPGGRCNLDLVSGTETPRGWRTSTVSPIRISGWAIGEVAQVGSPWVVVELVAPGDRARFFAVTTVRRMRSDLVTSLGDGPALSNAGFELVVRAESLPRERYAVYLLMRGGATGGLACATGRTLELV
jgi:hypothetical protein